MKFLSSVYTAVSGSVGGLTYSHNAGGMYSRSRATPTNPNTSAQQAARAAMSAASAQWAAFTDANRELWNDYAAATSWTDTLGQSIQVTGFQAFCRWATLRHRASLSIGSAPPAGTSGFGEAPVAIAIEITTPAATITISPATSDDGDVFLQLSAALSAGQSSTRQPLSLDSFGAVSAAATSATTTPIATLATGERRVARAVIAYDDGRVSAAYEEVITIAAS